MSSDFIIQSSFRDPSGFLFSRDGKLYRQVNNSYREDYDLLMTSGLYQALADQKLLVAHQEVNVDPLVPELAYKIIEPERIGFISYPYEWCFSQLKDAALLTLEIQKKALELGMSLKDCSAYNIQFHRGKPVFIDTLSFEKHRQGEPWMAYRQFCQHFLGPLALMSYKDVRLNQLLRVYIDGPPLDLVSSLLPRKTWLKPSMLFHIHFHAKSQRYFAEEKIDKGGKKMSYLSLLGLIDSLESAVKNLNWEPGGTEWADYYQNTNYSQKAFEQKKDLVAKFLEKTEPMVVWDLGANTGLFSCLAADLGAEAVSFDLDPAAVEKNYRKCRKRNETKILPLILDLTNPSPAIGWENKERMSFLERGPADTVLALALLHHLAISNNLPFGRLAEFFKRICQWLIIEFVPKDDSQTQRLLSSREDIFVNYTQENFEREFEKHFIIREKAGLIESERTLYLMKKKEQ